ncbi:MAG: tetratricopeptide (TPR) repeat protein [Paraglaciecola sp.]|jgi:tetratricopeptide (TPR) repeat protein
MKFTNIILSLMSLALLNSCSSLLPFDETEKNVSEAVEEPLTPLQTKVNTLQTLPNLYQTQTRKDKASAQTLHQFQGALLLKQQGKLSLARERFIALSEQHPNLSGVWLQLALLAKQQDNDDMQQLQKEMTRYLNNAISANPLNYLAHNEFALVLRQQGQFQQALNHYELAIKSWPAFAEGYLNRGILYDLYMGRKSLALVDYELYQALSDDNSRQLKGWIIDLKRQIKSGQQVTQAGAIL